MILVTGGTGFIGSHTVVELLEFGEEVIIIDNLSNSNRDAIKSITKITNKKLIFYNYDLKNKDQLEEIFSSYPINSVIHFAGLKAVGESMKDPILYYQNNIVGSINLFEVMLKHNCKKIVFSSSCTVYGNSDKVPFDENTEKQKCESPYGRTKSVCEDLLYGLYQSQGFQVANLRYFNPIGAHSTGLLGENPNGVPNNLLPYVMRTAAGLYEYVEIFGNDYPTKDGTCIRDYIHVVDLAKAHIKALERLIKQEVGVFESFNIGTGEGKSVLDIIQYTQEIIGKPLAHKIVDRREGDIVSAYANPSKAYQLLGRSAQNAVKEAILDMWNYQLKLNK